MLAAAQQVLGGHESVCLQLTGAPRGPRAFRVPQPADDAGAVPLGPNRTDRSILAQRLRRADLVHVHDLVPPAALGWLAELGIPGRVPMVYQAHSPAGGQMEADHGIAWAARIASAGALPRMFPGFRILPDCLFRGTLGPAANPWEEPNPVARIVVGGGAGEGWGAGGGWGLGGGRGAGGGRGLGGGRDLGGGRGWGGDRGGAAGGLGFEANLRALGTKSWAEVVSAEGMGPDKRLALRRAAEFGIDNLVSGDLHLATLETMASGGLAVTGADSEAAAALQMAARSDAAPPWLRAGPTDFPEAIKALADRPDRLAEARRACHDYFWTWLDPRRVVGLYNELYSEAAGG
jgi:hypothetical protein